MITLGYKYTRPCQNNCIASYSKGKLPADKMKGFVAIIVAGLLAATSAQDSSVFPCSKVCYGVCDFLDFNVLKGFLPLLNPFSPINVVLCKQGCAQVCGCSDTCVTKCKPQLLACRNALPTPTPSPIVNVNCVTTFLSCQADCAFECFIGKVAKTLTGVLVRGRERLACESDVALLIVASGSQTNLEPSWLILDNKAIS
ncbi:hypothetical protein PoB_000307200 [Plakobranchus ocellatus]|uniref:Uncharacterized protein n=1 Tax=Plakobranchus ocellatus TaxID=259542 RepID=A0AAV3Y3B7_9GAST|nr:hypothetical protein PoB_000307200 [Plakobranchus ocellatus]